MALDLGTLRGGRRLADGAWGTLLQQRGARPGELVECWNLDRPTEVRAVARAYVEAGARIVLTNTFRANRFVLEREGLADQVSAINAAGARLSRAAAGGGVLVFGSIGPSGKLLMRRDVSPAELADAFGMQARALADGGVDAILCETFFDLDELRIAVEAGRAAGLPVIASMTFDSGADQTRTMMGVRPEQAAAALANAGAGAVGCNCGVGIETCIAIVRRMRAVTALPIWAKPNAGLPQQRAGAVEYLQTPEQFAEHVPALLAAGADVVGGCCGTTPAFIAAARSRCDAGS